MKMQEIKIKKGSLINAGNFQVSIGIHDSTDIAIISKHTGNFVMVKNIKKGGKLAKVKRKFKLPVSGSKEFDSFNWQFMSNEKTIELINFLRK